MERLEAKVISGQTYYYYSKWGWVDGKCRRIWQKYLGKLENIAKAVESRRSRAALRGGLPVGIADHALEPMPAGQCGFRG